MTEEQLARGRELVEDLRQLGEVKGDEGFPNLRGKVIEPISVEAFRVTTGEEREQNRAWYRTQPVAWIWERYRVYRMEPGVYEGQAEGIEAFLRWVNHSSQA